MDIVYGLRRPGEPPRYIGQTKTEPRDRLRRHYTAARCGSSYPVHSWLRKHNDVEIIVIVANASWNDDEREVIRLARESGLRLLNCTSGGDSMRDLPLAQRQKISAANKGVPKTPEHKARIAAALKGRRRDHLGDRKWRFARGG